MMYRLFFGFFIWISAASAEDRLDTYKTHLDALRANVLQQEMDLLNLQQREAEKVESTAHELVETRYGV